MLSTSYTIFVLLLLIIILTNNNLSVQAMTVVLKLNQRQIRTCADVYYHKEPCISAINLNCYVLLITSHSFEVGQLLLDFRICQYINKPM